MTHSPDTLRCDGCGAEIYLAPISKDACIYCCDDCAHGRPCLCAERQERDDERRTPSA